jgi:hypothetical protein
MRPGYPFRPLEAAGDTGAVVRTAGVEPATTRLRTVVRLHFAFVVAGVDGEEGFEPSVASFKARCLAGLATLQCWCPRQATILQPSG